MDPLLQSINFFQSLPYREMVSKKKKVKNSPLKLGPYIVEPQIDAQTGKVGQKHIRKITTRNIIEDNLNEESLAQINLITSQVIHHQNIDRHKHSAHFLQYLPFRS